MFTVSTAHEFRMQELNLSELGGSSWEDPKSASVTNSFYSLTNASNSEQNVDETK